MRQTFETDQFGTSSAKRKRQRRQRWVAFGACAAAVGFYCLIAFWPKAAAQTTGLPPVPVSSSAVSSSAAPSKGTEKPAAEQVSLEKAKQPLWVHVSIAEQTVTVYDAQNRVVQQYVCSTGQTGDDTPTGTFTVSDKGESFYSPQYKEGAYYWTRFKGSFLFHSVPFDKNRKYKPEEAAKLGKKASHGCVRLATENAKWIYDHIAKGTKVVVE